MLPHLVELLDFHPITHLPYYKIVMALLALRQIMVVLPLNYQP